MTFDVVRPTTLTLLCSATYGEGNCSGAPSLRKDNASPPSSNECDVVLNDESLRSDAVRRMDGGASERSHASSRKREKLQLSESFL